MKKNKHIIILGILITLLVIMEYMAPKELDWKPSFKRQDKIPFGAYVMYDLLENAFPGSKIEENYKSIYQKLNGQNYQNTSYIIITDQFNPENVTLESLLSFAANGNKVFVSAEDFGQKISDTLGFNTTMHFSQKLMGDSVAYNFLNPQLKPDSLYWIKSAWARFYFESMDTLKSFAIAAFDTGNVVFFRLPFGKGEFLIHCQPYAFTNYNMLFKNNAEFAFKTFSYLKNEHIIWDEKNKPGMQNATPLVYILEQDALRAAYYLVLFLAIVFMFFGAKRLQRIIPVISPPENSSLEFAKTLGNLYLSNRNHRDIALKKFSYWLDFLREHYFVQIDNPDELDVAKISEKTGVDVDKIIKVRKFIFHSKTIGQEHLLEFNQLIENFHRNRK